MADMPTLKIVAELGRLRPEDEQKLKDIEDDESPLFVRWCQMYLRLIRPGRMGDMWQKPQWVYDIACIGDEVWTEMEMEMYNTND